MLAEAERRAARAAGCPSWTPPTSRWSPSTRVGSRDLDQAVHLAARGDGYRVSYAIADVGAFVRARRRARRRGPPARADALQPRPADAAAPAGAQRGRGQPAARPAARRPSLWTIDLDADGEPVARRPAPGPGPQPRAAGLPVGAGAGRRRHAARAAGPAARRSARCSQRRAAERGAIELGTPGPGGRRATPDGGWTLALRGDLPVEGWNAADLAAHRPLRRRAHARRRRRRAAHAARRPGPRTSTGCGCWPRRSASTGRPTPAPARSSPASTRPAPGTRPSSRRRSPCCAGAGVHAVRRRAARAARPQRASARPTRTSPRRCAGWSTGSAPRSAWRWPPGASPTPELRAALPELPGPDGRLGPAHPRGRAGRRRRHRGLAAARPGGRRSSPPSSSTPRTAAAPWCSTASPIRGRCTGRGPAARAPGCGSGSRRPTSPAGRVRFALAGRHDAGRRTSPPGCRASGRRSSPR